MSAFIHSLRLARSARRIGIFGLALGVALSVSDVALALDYQLCGVGNTPPTTGWNGHTDTKTRTVTLGCGQVETFTVDFYAELTFADKQLGAIEWVLADGNPGNNDLLTTLLDCPQILALPVGTDFIGFAEFRLKCTPGCIVEGVDIIAIDLMTWPDLQTRCRIAFPPAIVGDSGGQGAILSLRDDTGFHERMCNTMKIRCSQFSSSMSINPPNLPHGTDGTFMITSPDPVFTDSTDVTWGVDGDIQVVSTVVMDAFTVESTVSVPLSVTPGPLTLLVNNVNDIPSSLPFTIDPLRWANVDVGLGSLTVTDQGRLGWLDAEHTIGDGLSFSIRPWMPNCSAEECTDFGGAMSLWSGSGPEHVANRDYSDDEAADADWSSTGDPVAFVERAGYDQAVVSRFVDAAPLTTGLSVEQQTLGLSTAFGGQVLFLEYRLTNTGLPIESNHTGVFLDVDMHGDGSNDLGVADPAAHIAYMRDAEFDGIVGLVCVKPYDWPRLPAPGTVGARGTPRASRRSSTSMRTCRPAVR